MAIHQQADGKIDAQTLKGLLAEYNALRSEMHHTQQQRMQLISLTVGAFGVILSVTGGIVLGSEAIDPARRLLVAIGGAIMSYAITIPSLIMMISTQQGVQRLGGYIRIFIEPQVPGLNWQHHWHSLKAQHQFKGGLSGMGGIYYFLSILPLLLPIYAVSQYISGWAATITLIPFITWSIYLSHNLQTASRGWERARWEDYCALRSV